MKRDVRYRQAVLNTIPLCLPGKCDGDVEKAPGEDMTLVCSGAGHRPGDLVIDQCRAAKFEHIPP